MKKENLTGSQGYVNPLVEKKDKKVSEFVRWYKSYLSKKRRKID